MMTGDAGSLIRGARRAAGLSQVELGRRAGVTQRMRDRLAHRYFDISRASLAATIEHDLPELERAARPHVRGLTGAALVAQVMVTVAVAARATGGT